MIDSADHSKRYRIWEQNYSNDKLNGRWNIYTLRGTLVSYQTFKNDSLNGMAKDFWIDGKTVIDETEYFNGRNKLIKRNYYDNGNGTIIFYNENGSVREIKTYVNGEEKE